jgi:hypothetical protein
MFELLHVLGVLLENKQLGETLKGGWGWSMRRVNFRNFDLTGQKETAGQGKAREMSKLRLHMQCRLNLTL